MCCAEETRKEHQNTNREEEVREKRRRGIAISDRFEPNSKHFLRDRRSSKFLGKFYKLSNVINRLKIELEIVWNMVFRERK